MINVDQLPDGKHKLKKAYVYCQGLKKRERTIKNHSFSLGYFEPTIKLDEIEDMAKTLVRETMKSLNKPVIEVSLQNTEIELRDNMRMERFSCYDVFDREKKVYDFSL